MGEESDAQAAARDAHDARLRRAASGRRTTVFGLVGAALGAAIRHFLVTDVARPTLVGALVGLLVGRVVSRSSAAGAVSGVRLARVAVRPR